MRSESNHSDPRYYERDYALDRLIMLSDGVFAIAMTLMALEVHPAGAWEHTLSGLFDAILGPFVAFFWSFFGTGIFWTTHRRLFGRYTRSTAVLTGINLVLLGQITLIPVATRLLGGVFLIPGALAVYLSLYGLIGATFAVMWVYAWGAGLLTAPRPGPAGVVVLAVTLTVLPVSMTALGLLSNFPSYHWLPALMPAVYGVAMGLRRLADWFDGRRAKAALRAAGAADKVQAT
jgi:uncharacterized membrane protein